MEGPTRTQHDKPKALFQLAQNLANSGRKLNDGYE
jgi:hypothetical protein